jgi:hypothetical protein
MMKRGLDAEPAQVLALKTEIEVQLQ